MKKILIMMLIAGFACSPLVVSQAQASGAKAKVLTHKIEKKKQQIHKLKEKRKAVKQHAGKAKPAAKHKVA